MSPTNKKPHFFKGLVSFTSYYDNTYLKLVSCGLLLCSLFLSFWFPSAGGKALFSLFTFFLLLKEFFQYRDSERRNHELLSKKNEISKIKEERKKEIQKSADSLVKDILHSLLAFLGKYFNFKGGFRFTIFTLSQKNGVECIKSVYRTSFGSKAGVSEDHTAYFTKGHGLPGKSWADAWDKENLEDLIDRIKLGNVPGSILDDNIKLKEYYKKKFDVTEEIFNSLGDDKNQIKSYLAIGVVGQRNELSYVLSIDSIEEGVFDDFQTLKGIKDGKEPEITEIHQGTIEATTKMDNEESAKHEAESEEKTRKFFPKVEIPKEFLEVLPPEGRELFEKLEEVKSSEITGMAFASMKQAGIKRPKVDRFVHTFGMILKIIESIKQQKIYFS